MARFDLVQTNFTRGELSPRLQGRIDFDGFYNGVARMENFLPVIQGAAVRRPGTRYTATQNDAGRLLPFEFSVEETYALSFGDRELQFYTDKDTTDPLNPVRNSKERLRAPNTGLTIVNGDFDTDLSGWSTASGGSSSVVQLNGVAQLQAVSGEQALLEQKLTIASTATGRDHFVRFDIGTIQARKAQGVTVQVGTSGGLSDLFERTLPPGSHVIKFNPGSNLSVYLGFKLDDPNNDVTVFVDKVEPLSDEPVRLKTPYGADTLQQISWAQSADVLFLAHPDFYPRELLRFARDEFSIVFHDFKDGPWNDVNQTETTLEIGGTSGRVSVTASSEIGINGGAGFQAGDIGRLIRFRDDNTPSKSIQGDGNTTLFTFDFAAATEQDVRVTLTNTSGGTVQNIGAGATIEAIPGVDYSLTLRDDLGGNVDFSISKAPASEIEVNISRDDTFWGWLEIIQIVNTTQVEAVVRSEDGLSGTGPSDDWRLGEWTGENLGFPQVVTFHDQRLTWGSSSRNPQGVWLSKVGAFNTHSPSAPDGTVNDDDAIDVKLATSQVNFVRWLSSFSNGLAIGTSGSEFLLRASSTAQPLAPTNIQAAKQTRRGSAPFVPEANIGHSIFFVQRDRQTIREAAFDFDTNGLVATDLSVFSEHLLRPGVTRMAYQQSPESILWLLRDDGVVVGFTVESDQQVFAWTRHNFKGTVKSLTTITDPATETDKLWLIVEREINGSTVRHVEYMEDFWFEDRDGVEEIYYVDGGVTWDIGTNTAGEVNQGLDHLEGEEVAIVADGAIVDRQTVQNGSVPLETTNSNFQASVIHVGLPNEAIIKTFPYDQGQRGNTSKGKIKRISQIHVLFSETVGVLYGRDTLNRLPFRDSGMKMDQPVKPFTGEKTISLSSKHDERAFIQLRNDQPLPVSVLTLTVEMEFNDL